MQVQQPAITCAYAMQPAVIEGLAANPAFRGRGLLARFLYAAPKSWIGKRTIAPDPVPESTQAAYHDLVRRLAEIAEDTVLGLDFAASERLKDWEHEIEEMLRDGGVMERMRDWGSKLAGETLRLAAALHCAEFGANGHIDVVTLESAIEIARYSIPHAEVVLGMMQARESSQEQEGARYLLRWIQEGKLREFTKRDAHQHGRRRFPKAEDVDPALEELSRRGYIRQRPTKTSGPGRPPSPVYEVNPAILHTGEPERCAQYPQNSASKRSGGNCVDIEDASPAPDAQPATVPSGDEWGEL